MPKQDIRPFIQEGLKKLDQNEYQASLETFGKARGVNPEHPVPYFFISLIHLILNQIPEVQEILQQGIEKDPENNLGKNLQALLKFREGKPEDGLALLKKTGMAEHPRIQALFLYEIEKAFMREPQ